jgi:fatty-acyl-CoA synthase
LSPIGFLRRSAVVYPQRSAVIHGNRRYSWREAQMERIASMRRYAAATDPGRTAEVAENLCIARRGVH